MKDHFDYTVDAIRDSLERHGIPKCRTWGNVHRFSENGGVKIQIVLLVRLDDSYKWMDMNTRVQFIRDKLQNVELHHVTSIIVLTESEYQERLMNLVARHDWITL